MINHGFLISLLTNLVNKGITTDGIILTYVNGMSVGGY